MWTTPVSGLQQADHGIIQAATPLTCTMVRRHDIYDARDTTAWIGTFWATVIGINQGTGGGGGNIGV